MFLIGFRQRVVTANLQEIEYLSSMQYCKPKDSGSIQELEVRPQSRYNFSELHLLRLKQEDPDRRRTAGWAFSVDCIHCNVFLISISKSSL